MDDICVIDCKKVDVTKFQSSSSKTSNDNSISDNNLITNTPQSNSDSVLFYDKVTKKIIQATTEGLKVYNKKFTKLFKEIKIQTNPEKLISVIVDQNINYLLCREIIDGSNNKKKNQSILNLLSFKKRMKCCRLTHDFDFLLGMFFINPLEFCLVFADKIVFNEIKINSDKLEKISRLFTVTVSNKKLIKNFSFNSIRKILFIMNTDYSVELYDLNKKQLYKDKHEIKIPNDILNKIKLSSTLGSFKKANYETKKRIVGFYESMDKYTESQFYLECLYEQLYLIFLSYENNKIFIFEIENLQNLKLIMDINYNKHARCSGLQIKDNLIILHNFAIFLTAVIDIKSQQALINTSHNVHFPYRNNLFINGEILEERRQMNNNNIFLEGGNMYNISFNPEKYVNISTKFILKKKKEKKINKKLEKKENIYMFNYYDMLFNILNRKNTKDCIIKILHKMILQNNKCMDIIPFLYKIIERIKIKNKINIMKNSSNNENISNADIILYNNVIKNFISQDDIYFSLFNEFHKDINNIIIEKCLNDNQNINYSKLDERVDTLLYKIIFYLVIFSNKLIRENISLEKSYSTILVEFLYLMKNLTKIITFLQNRNILDNQEIGTYLLAMAQKNNNKYSELFEQMGLDILVRLKKYDLLLEYYLNNKSIWETLSYLKNYGKYLPYAQIKNLMHENKNFFKKNKSLLAKYLKI